MNNSIKLFEDKRVRVQWVEEEQKWYFSIADVIAVLTESIDPSAYWRKLKERLKAEGNETVTNCHTLKLLASDGKMRLTDVGDTEQILRLVQSCLLICFLEPNTIEDQSAEVLIGLNKEFAKNGK